MDRRRLVVLALMAVIIVVAAGLGVVVVAYDRVSRVAADCEERFGGNSPASWSVRGISSAVPEFDGSALFTSEYREVHIASRDAGIELRAWWLPSVDGVGAPSVVVLHGFGTCVRDPAVLAPAGMLHRLGYEVLMVDVRDHGASTIEDGRTAGGTEEYRDVLGAVDWLVAQGAEPGRIGLLGTSMGAAAAIIAAGQDERVAAVWADSGYSDLETRIAEGLEQWRLPRQLAPLAMLVASVVSGDDLSSHTPVGEVAGLVGRDLFIVHGTADGLIDVSHADALDSAARSAGVRTERWVVDGAGHVDAALLYPEVYERRLGQFFGPALGL